MNRNRRESRYTKSRPVYPKPTILYRNLLKQSRKLQDPASRYFFQTQTRLRFRGSQGHSHSIVGSTTLPPRDALLNDALYHLAKLTRANKGSPNDLEYVVGVTYGLMGPIISEREKYRRLLNFKPGHHRLHPTPESNKDHFAKLKKLERMSTETQSRVSSAGQEQAGTGFPSHPPSHPPQFDSRFPIMDQIRARELDRYQQHLVGDKVLGELYAAEKKLIDQANSLGGKGPQFSPFLAYKSAKKRDQLIHHAMENGPGAVAASDTPLHDALNSLQHLRTNINPITLSPYVYQPFKYGQAVAIMDPVSKVNNSILKKHSTLSRYKKRLVRAWNPLSSSDVQSSTYAASAQAPPHLSLVLLPDGAKPPERSLTGYFTPELTIYSSRHPVHPRVQLSFEYQLEPFMYSVLYFLSTRSTDLRRAFRAWPDFGWVPMEQEVYDRIFSLAASQSPDGTVLDPREIIRKNFGEGLDKIERSLAERRAQNDQNDQEGDCTPGDLSRQLKEFASELHVELGDEFFSLDETVLSQEQNSELIESLWKKKKSYLQKFPHTIPPTYHHKLPVPKAAFDFTTQSQSM